MLESSRCHSHLVDRGSDRLIAGEAGQADPHDHEDGHVSSSSRVQYRRNERRESLRSGHEYQHEEKAGWEGDEDGPGAMEDGGSDHRHQGEDRDRDEGRRGQPGHEPGARDGQGRQLLGVEVLVEREDDHREGDPGDEEDDRSPAEILRAGQRLEGSEGGGVADGESPTDPPDQRGDQRQAYLALAVSPQAVPEQPGLQAGEDSNHASSRSSTAPPTAAMKASSTVETPIFCLRPSGVSSNNNRPWAMIPIRVHSFPTRCISWDEKTMVAPSSV